MKTLLEQLYNGQINPSEKIVAKTPTDQALNKKIQDQKKALKDALSSYDGKCLDDLGNMELQRSSALAFEAFAYGFRLGIGLMADTMDAPAIPGDE